MALLNSCKDENEMTSGFSVDKKELTIGENGGTETVQVSGDVQWQTTVDATWVRVLPSNGVGSTLCEVKIDSSVVAEPRYAEIQFMAPGGKTETVHVTQTGYMKGVFVENADQEIIIENSAEYGKRFYNLQVTANMNFKVSVDAGESGWLKYSDKVPAYDYGDRPRTFNQRFDWITNVTEEERTATVTITPINDNNEENVAEPLVLKFRQKAAPEITDNRAGDSLAILAIYESMNGMLAWDSSENMMYWDGVELWKATDLETQEPGKKGLIGRVKSVEFRMLETYESIPYQIKYLKTAKSLYFSGNTNTFLKSIELGPEICELAGEGKNLKELTISAYGLVKLPEGFKEFGKNLEMLDLSSNNFEYDALEMINPDNFKQLKKLRLNKINRFDTTKDLTNLPSDSVGFRWYTGFGNDEIETALPEKINRNFFMNLLKWESLEELSLSLNLLEGELPSDEDLLADPAFPRYTQEYINGAANKDTISAQADKYLLNAPRVWPKMKSLSINLCFLTGKLPKWILYHPYLAFWNPYQMIFTQETEAINSAGMEAGFEAEPTSLSNYSNLGNDFKYSYYQLYPKLSPNYDEDASSGEGEQDGEDTEDGSSSDGTSAE